MLSYFCKDRAGQYVKTIVDCNRCDICDTLDGDRMRFSCGHSACADCVAASEECPTCTPLKDSNCTRPRFDLPQTERAKHASELLTSFQDTYQIDVYQRQRLSEKLKVEKELFPECIQAPYQYINKRKSLNVSKGKENRGSTFFPGEGTSSLQEVTMNKSKNFVQEWLNKNEDTSPSMLSRSPFSDLKVNTLSNHKTRHSKAVKDKENVVKIPSKQSNRKRSRLKTSLSTSNTQLNLENYLKPVEKGKNKEAWMSAKRLKRELSSTKEISKGVCDESGIVIDDDCISIEDTQDQVIDKDRLALLEVAKAEYQTSNPAVVLDDTQERSPESCKKDLASGDNTQQMNLNKKVPFYKKSFLFETCDQCVDSDTLNAEAKMHHDENETFKDLSITVENSSFITTIQVVDCKHSLQKQSTAIQTDVVQPFLGFEQSTQTEETAALISKIKDYIENESTHSLDKVMDRDSQRTSCSTEKLGINQAINNVDEDVSEVEDLHREHGYGILTELGGLGFQNKSRKPARGVTPDSNNSSDKENCDPNRKKKSDAKKKKKKGNK